MLQALVITGCWRIALPAQPQRPLGLNNEQQQQHDVYVQSLSQVFLAAAAKLFLPRAA